MEKLVKVAHLGSLLFRIILLACVCTVLNAADAASYDLGDDEVSITLPSTSWQPLNKNLLGFNQSSPPLKNVNIKSFYSWQLVNDLKPVQMRFPGGTEANFYRWATDSFVPSDLDIYKSQDSEYNRKVFEKFGPNGEKIGFQDYVDWLLANEVKSSFVLNISTDPDLADALTVLKMAQQRGVEIRYVELGNELYFPGQGGDKFINPVSYTALASTITEKVKQTFPDVKCGAATWGVLYNGRMMPWDVELARNQWLFDALVLHIYFKSDSIPMDYINSPAFDYTERQFPDLLAVYRNTFPGKEFWITEWNIENKPFYDVNKTLYGTIFAADFFMALIRQVDIKIANYHSLLGNTHCLLEAYYHYKESPFYAERNLPYYLWLSLGKLFATNDSWIEPRIVSAAEPMAINALAFSGAGKIHLLIVNRSGRGKTIKLPGFRNAALSNEVITGPSLAHALKMTDYRFEYERDVHLGGSLVIKSHSINFVTIDEAPTIKTIRDVTR